MKCDEIIEYIKQNLPDTFIGAHGSQIQDEQLLKELVADGLDLRTKGNAYGMMGTVMSYGLTNDDNNIKDGVNYQYYNQNGIVITIPVFLEYKDKIIFMGYPERTPRYLYPKDQSDWKCLMTEICDVLGKIPSCFILGHYVTNGNNREFTLNPQHYSELSKEQRDKVFSKIIEKVRKGSFAEKIDRFTIPNITKKIDEFKMKLDVMKKLGHGEDAQRIFRTESLALDWRTKIEEKQKCLSEQQTQQTEQSRAQNEGFNIQNAINECLNNPIVREMCERRTDMTMEEKKAREETFARIMGYCMLFRSSEGIEDYMSIEDTQKQIDFVKKKIAEKLQIPESEIDSHREEMYLYAYKNFVEDGFVFHGCNSASAEEKMTNGLMPQQISEKQKEELMHITDIFLKYGQMHPFIWAATDIKKGNDGWFFDGTPQHMLHYANSPEWFGQLCGEGFDYAYGFIPEEKRHAYASRDYSTCLENVIALIEKKKMSEQDKQEILKFFNKCWNSFGNTTPQMLLIPNSEIFGEFTYGRGKKILEFPKERGEEDYLDKFIKEQILTCTTMPGFIDKHCKDQIAPDKLITIDLSPIMPRTKAQKEQDKDLTLEECIQMLRGFDSEALWRAKALLKTIEKTGPSYGKE